MSWFDTSGFANLARSAIKGAQKTIDKALDIKDEELKAAETPGNDSTDFFESWGVKSETTSKQECAKSKDDLPGTNKQQTSMWGSFTGSFFENPKGDEKDKSRKLFKEINAPQESQLSSSKLYRESLSEEPVIDSEASQSSQLQDENPSVIAKLAADTRSDKSFGIPSGPLPQKTSKSILNLRPKEDVADTSEITVKIVEESSQEVCFRDESRLDAEQSNQSNRTSIVSSEGGDVKSTESVEVIGSQSTDCTNTPESDVASISDNASAESRKANSDSVEVCPDNTVSITSPSSVEVLSKTSPYYSPVEDKEANLLDLEEDESPISGKQQVEASETSGGQPESSSLNISTFEVEDSFIGNALTPDSTTSPESVEVIPETDDPEELSLADDSYTSASESTVTTVMDSSQLDKSKVLEFADRRMHDSCPVEKKPMMKLVVDSPLNLSLDSVKEKRNLHLPLEAITTQPAATKSDFMESMEKSDMFDRLKSSTIEPPDPEECEQVQKNEIIESTDQYLMLTDSSCEGTLIESSSEDNTTLLGKAEAKVAEAPLTASSYVKTMLADAMGEEKGEVVDMERQCIQVPRDNSPISSER